MQDIIGLLSELPSGAWATLGVVVGSLIAYLSTKFSARAQVFSAEILAEKDVQIHRATIQAGTERWRQERMLEKLERAHQILCDISMSFSQTQMYFTDEDRISVDEFRQWYRIYCRKLHKSLSYVSFYLEHEGDTMREIYGQMNIYWGEMEGMLIAHKEGKMDVKRERLERALVASNEIADKSAKVRRRIERFANVAASPLSQ